MLNAKENMLEVIRGGNPVRFANQYEAVNLLFTPHMMFSGAEPLRKGGPDVKNAWGVTNSFPDNVPGMFPVHTPELIVLKDIENWREYVKAPPTEFTDEQWEMVKGMYDAVDGTQTFKATFIAPGLFEQTHHLSEISNALTYLYTHPDEMHDLIKYLTDYELAIAEGVCKHLKPEALFHHDDWGSERSTFMSPDMFGDFFVEPYKEIYGYYKANGVELVIHHADSFGATIVPHMIEMGIDVWQGCMESNDLPTLIKKYGGQITFMGGIDNKSVDYTGWTQEDVRKKVREVLDACGSLYFIPCITQGGPGSLYEGTYDAITQEIDKYSMEVFGIQESDIIRLPGALLF